MNGNNPLDAQLEHAMDSVLEILVEHPENKESAEVLKMRIVSSNLHGLANMLLIADSRSTETEVDLKQLVLGILATADWLVRDLPSLDPEIDRNIQPKSN